jgi:hypothetical protein
MSSKNISIDPKALTISARLYIDKVKPYSFVAFLIFVALIYGFVFLRIGSLKGAEPSQLEISSQVQAAQVPHINERAAAQLKSLQDNSVSVQALFNQARSNPFQ